MKKCLVGLVFVCVLTLGLAINATAAEIVASGECGTNGDNVTWTLDNDGLLTINGIGDMTDYAYVSSGTSNAPWYDSRETITSVIISDGITSIGKYAFAYCSNLTNASIPSSVKSIGYCAFGRCTNLGSVTIADGVTSIADGAFIYCSSLNSIIIPNSVNDIGLQAFRYCSSLTSITISNSVTNIGNYTFSDCISLNSVIIPKSVTSIGFSAFSGCTSLVSIDIPSSVISIGGYAFRSCSNLESVIIPNSVTIIDSNTFSDCSSLTSIGIPDSVIRIGYNAFSNCSSLISVVIPNSVTSIGNYAFSDCTSLTDISIPNNVSSIGNYTFSNCTSLVNVTIPENVNNIGEYAFSNCMSLSSITIPENVINIGKHAFSDCTSLNSINIPNSITTIDDYAFYRCRSLTDIIIPDNVTYIGVFAFADCISLTSIDIPNSVTSINSFAFSNCVNLTTLTIPDSVKSIGQHTFASLPNVTHITMPVMTSYYSNDPFQSDKSINYIKLTGTGKWGSFNYDDSPWYVSSEAGNEVVVEIDEGVTSIGNKAFFKCTNLTNVIIPNSVTDIGSMAFYRCKNLDSITLPDEITIISSWMFYECTSLTEIIIPQKVSKIYENAFGGCVNLTSITIPDSVTTISASVFNACPKMTDVYFQGTKEQWNNISIADYNSALTSATIHYIGESDNPAEEHQVIPSDAVNFNGHSYYLFSNTSGGAAAEAYCESLGGHLATITSAEENAFLYSYIKSLGYNNAFFGFTDFEKEGTWKWVTGEPVSYTNWHSGEPNAETSSEDWAMFYWKYTDGKWNDGGPSTVSGGNQYICEWDGNGTNNIDIKVEAGKYCILVVDENGKPLKDAAVSWKDWADISTIEHTDSEGKAFFNLGTIGTPLITVSLKGYVTWTNANSNWAKSSDRYSKVILYPESYGAYKLATAFYSASEDMSLPYDLLTVTKKLNLKNDGNLIGDLTSGDFYLSCTALETSGIARYELWQKNQIIAQTTNGNFGKLSVKSFSKGGGCFIRVVTTDGKPVDTNINLEFAENTVQKETGISILSDKIGITVADDVPFLGGSTFNIGGVGLLPVEIKATEDKIYVGFNAKIWDSSDDSEGETKGKFDDFKKSIQKVAKANETLGKRGSDLMNSWMKTEPDFELPGGKVKINVIGYAEGNWGSSTFTGEIYIIFKATTPTFGFTTWVVAVPVTAQINGYVEVNAGAKVTYNWDSSTLEGEFPLTITVGLDAFGGVGVGPVAGAGAYGAADLNIDTRPLDSPIFRSVDITGELGFKAYVGPFTYQRAFAHNTWHLYTANEVKSMSLMGMVFGSGENRPTLTMVPVWNKGIYDATAYTLDDLSYLEEESDWLSGSASGSRRVQLMASSEAAKTEFSNLLTDTYRNAQPVMVSSGDALYAAFVRADTDTGTRYLVVTKYNGTSWSTPVQVDADAILDDAPVLCVDNSGTVWLAYARTTSDPGNSLLTYAQNQEIVVGSIDSDTLKFAESKTYSGDYTHLQQLGMINGQSVLAWMDSTVTDENSVLRPESGTICYAICSGGSWGGAMTVASINVPVDSLTLGASAGTIAMAYTSDDKLYRVTLDGQQKTLAEEVSGNVSYGTLPGSSTAAFIWNADNILKSSEGDFVAAGGISHEYVIVGNNIYYSMADGDSANLAVLQYDSGNWSLPIQLTGDNRYLENLSAARLNGSDYVFGMHTAVSITEGNVEDAKNLVWSRIMPVSDLRLDGISFDDEGLTAGDTVPVILTVTNAGDHTVSGIDIMLNGTSVKSETCGLLPGMSLEVETSVTCPSTLTFYSFSVAETGEDDYSPEDNSYEVSIGYADVETELIYQQIGTSKSLIAAVTNVGVETASGSIIFYNADGDAVAESTFENLASGDTTIVTYELRDNFAGINGGDVSVSVTLNQDEIYTYNNSASLYIMKPETEIKSVGASGMTVKAQIYCESGITATAYCAFYSNAGRMLDVQTMALDPGTDNAPTFAVNSSDAAYVRIFVLNTDSAPICTSKRFDLT